MSASPEDLARFHVQLEERPNRGRVLIATKDLLPGHLVLSNQPYSRTLHPTNWESRCFYCFETLKEVGIQSSCIWYCSKICQQNDYLPNHRIEGPLLKDLRLKHGSNDILSDMILVARTLRRIHSNNKEQEAMYTMLTPQQTKQTTQGGDEGESTPIVSTSEDVRALVYHEPSDLSPVQKVAEDVLNSGLLGVNTTNITVDEIVRTLLCFGCNNFAVTNNLLVVIGAAVCPAGAILNHACIPNTAVTWNPLNGAQELRCCCSVLKGEELTHSYIDAAVPTSKRRMRLRNHYGFLCDCARCSRPTMTQLAPAFRMELKMASLQHAASKQKNSDNTIGEFIAKVDELCNLPEHEWDIDECMYGDLLGQPIGETSTSGSDMNQARSIDLIEAEQLMQTTIGVMDMSEQYSILKKVNTIYSKWLHPLHLDRLSIDNEMLSVALALGNFKNAVGHVRRVIVVYDHIYGTTYYHPMVGLQM
jgi:hypothetical protein